MLIQFDWRSAATRRNGVAVVGEDGTDAGDDDRRRVPLGNPDELGDEDARHVRRRRLHPDDAELKKRAEANDYPSRFRK